MKEQYEEQLRLAEEVSDEFCLVPLVCPLRGAHARRGERPPNLARRVYFFRRNELRKANKKETCDYVE